MKALKEAFTVALTAWLFASAVAVVMVVGLKFDVPPLPLIERLGIDYGMWLSTDVGSYLSLTPRHNETGTRYAFVDVDEHACQLFADHAPTAEGDACRTGKPIPQGLIADFVRAARTAAAAVLIVDVAPPEDKVQRERLRDLLVNGGSDGPWIIAPVFARPNGLDADGPSLNGDRALDIVASRAEGRLRLASFAAMADPEADDDTVRGFPEQSRWAASRSGETCWIPSAPYLAAQLAADPHSASLAERSLYGVPCVTDPKKADMSSRSRLLFSLPGLSAVAPRHAERLAAAYRHIYTRYRASDLIDADCTGRTPNTPAPCPGFYAEALSELRDRIVVLGTSEAVALDRHQTPIGPCRERSWS